MKVLKVLARHCEISHVSSPSAGVTLVQCCAIAFFAVRVILTCDDVGQVEQEQREDCPDCGVADCR